MSDIRKYIRHIFWLFVTLFVFVTGYFLHFIFFVAPNITNSTLNPRVRIVREDVIRGKILDRHGQVVAYSNEYGLRIYPFGTAFSHVVGHIGLGHAGVEERYNFNLTNLSLEIWQRTRNIAFDEAMTGDSINLTLDANLQNHVYNVLGTNTGSIVIIEPSTGDILAMVSYPNYDPNHVISNWQELANRLDSPLLNRAAQGIYAPGSTFKTLTAAIGIHYGFSDFHHYCIGYININGEIIRCFNSVAHGHMNMSDAFAVSCNSYFVALAYYIGLEYFVESMYYYFLPINFSLAHSTNQFNLDHDSDLGEFMQTAIGQGRTLMTPLYMTMLTSAIANQGIMNMPNIVNQNNLLSFLNESGHTIFSHYQYEKLQDMMIQVVNHGTGANASLSGYQLAGKTGTAENEAGASHGWFTGFVVDQDIAITVMLEHSGGTAQVLPMIRDILTYALN